MNNPEKNPLQLQTSPFDKAILNLSKKIFSRPDRLDELSVLIRQQLQLLRTVYLSMLEIDFFKKIQSQPTGTGTITLEEAVLAQPIDNFKVFLNYFLFLTIINQFGRVLKKYPPSQNINLPLYNRTRFYRNKVLEHWDESIENINHVGSCTFVQGKPAIPAVEGIINPEERKKLRDDLINAFHQNGIDISIPDLFIGNMISTRRDYSNLIFENLEKIDAGLYTKPAQRRCKISDDIINLLFKFGFPAPVWDVEEYSKDLIHKLSPLL